MRIVFILSIVACNTLLRAQSAGIVTGRVTTTGNGAQPVRAGITIVSSGAAVQMNSVPTGDDGTFTMEAPAGAALIIARADGYASEQREIAVRSGRGNAHIHFSLLRAGTVSGRVVDPSGAGVPGARVWVQYRGENRTWHLADETGGEESDRYGYFRIPAVAEGRPFVLHAESEEWLLSSSQTISLRTPNLEGVLLLLSRRGSVVSGRVLDGVGRPVAGAEIRVRVDPAETAFTADQRQTVAFARKLVQETVSGPDGAWSVRGLPRGRAVVTGVSGKQRGFAEADTSSGTDVSVDLLLR